MIQVVECPRDAMQGLKYFVPTSLKVSYLNTLLKVGFHTLDFGSFVSPKAIPQMRDTHQLMDQLELSATKLLSIVANVRGAQDACKYPQIDYIGYPFSISETFQMRNTRATIEESLDRVKHIQSICLAHQKKLVVYLSMGFGNPYGDLWHPDIVLKWVNILSELDIEIFAISDTIGIADVDSIEYVFSTLIPEHKNLIIGAHLHTTPDTASEKIEAAYKGGCRRFDGALGGYGGCPMAKDELVGNMPTEVLIDLFQKEWKLNDAFLSEALKINTQIFNK